MKKPDVAKLFRTIKVTALKKSPEILTGLGIVGIGVTVVLTATATVKAVKLIEEEKANKGDDEELTKAEVVKIAWKPYIPAATTGIVSIGCIVGASSVSARRNAALYSAYKIAEMGLEEYKDAATETIGEKKAKDIRDKVAEKRMESDPVTKSDVIPTNQGGSLCYDHWAGRYFYSDRESIRSAFNSATSKMLDENYISLNDLYDELNLSRTSMGDNLGWNVYMTRKLEPEFSSQLADDGRPCMVVGFNKNPDYDYWKS